MQFDDRRHAGHILAGKLSHYYHQPNVLVLGLPRGGVPVAFEVSQALGAPLEVFIVRKLGVPGHEEYAMGAIATGGVTVFNSDAAALAIPQSAVNAIIEREKKELIRRETLYRDDRPTPVLDGRTVIVVDDGLATGSTMKAAIQAVKAHGARRIVVAVPVGAASTCTELKSLVDELVCAEIPRSFHAVGEWYRDFGQTSDEEVRALLDAAWHTQSTANME